MKETGMLFKPEMIRAINEDRKTQTRRLIKPQPPEEANSYLIGIDSLAGQFKFVDTFNTLYAMTPFIKCPYGRKGDLLWVKEGFVELVCNEIGQLVYGGPYIPPRTFVIYKADEKNPKDYLWKSPLFMPKKYARLWLELTADPIPQRVQEITEEDAKAEGAEHSPIGITYRTCFRVIWDSINKKTPWTTNPWAWKLEFKKIER